MIDLGMSEASEPGPERRPFGERFCRKFRCGQDGYERILLRRCLRRPGLPGALFLRVFSPSSLHGERVLMRDLWRARSLREVDESINYYRGLQPPNSSFWRVRFSRRRLLALARTLFDGESE